MLGKTKKAANRAGASLEGMRAGGASSEHYFGWGLQYIRKRSDNMRKHAEFRCKLLEEARLRMDG